MATKYPDIHCIPMCDGECHRQRTDWKGKWYDFYLEHNVNPVRVMGVLTGICRRGGLNDFSDSTFGCINRYFISRIWGIK
jgi:hypothetical protein